jgi:hypothetical protein
VRYWKPSCADSLKLTELKTADVTAILAHHAKAGLGARTLSHAKWFMSGVYEHATASGIVPKNPVPDAKWLCKVDRPAKQMEYSLPEVLSMLSILGARNIQAAGAVALLKTENFAGSVPVIEPLRILLERLRSESTGEYILSNSAGKPIVAALKTVEEMAAEETEQ